MNLNWTKSIKIIKKFFFFFFIYIFFIIIGDITYSNLTKDEKIQYDCFHYKNVNFNNKAYHDYYLKKNCTATEKQRTVLPYKVYTDKDGYRYSGKKRNENKQNVVFLGDSQTYGYGSKFEDTFVGMTDKNISDFEIYNLGMPGYGIKKYYYTLNEFLENKSVKKVFVILDMTDVTDASLRWVDIPDNISPVVMSNDTNQEMSRWKKIKNSNFKGTRLLIFYVRNFMRYIKLKVFSTNLGTKDGALKTNLANFTYTDIENHQNLDKEKFDYSLKTIEEYFFKISELSKVNNFELYLIIFPWPETLIYGQKKFNWENFNSELCKKNNCKKLINLFGEFKRIKDKDKNWKHLIYIDDDVHLKKLGNSIIGNKIIEQF